MGVKVEKSIGELFIDSENSGSLNSQPCVIIVFYMHLGPLRVA